MVKKNGFLVSSCDDEAKDDDQISLKNSNESFGEEEDGERNILSEELEDDRKEFDVDEFFLYIGQFGRTQKFLLFLFYLLMIPHSYHTLSWYFTGHSPAWKCSLLNGTHQQCNHTNVIDIGDSLYERRCLMARKAWTYVKPKDYSIVTEWDLVCDKKEYPYIANSMMWVGWATGAFVLGFASDRYGRKKVLLGSWTGLIILTFSCAFLKSFWLYSAIAFLIGFCQGGIALTIYVMASEIVGPKYKSLTSGALTGLTYTLCLCLLSVQSWLIPRWRMFMVVTSIPYVVLMVSFKFIPESIRWLRLNNRVKEAEHILRFICKWNKERWPNASLKIPEARHRDECSLISLFSNGRLTTNTLLLGFVWFVIGQVYFGISLASDQLGGNIYRDFILTSLVGVPGNLLVVVLTNRYGRKPTLVGSMAFGSISCFGVAFVHPNSDYAWLRVSFGMIGQLCLALAFSSMYSWSLELMPTVIRSQAMGMLSVLIRFGGSSAPWVAQWLEHFHNILPFSVMGGLALFSSILCTQLPETLGVPTIETMEDAIRHSKRKRFAKTFAEEITEGL